MNIIKRLCNRQWATTVLCVVYLNPSSTDTVIEHDKCNLTILLVECDVKECPNFDRQGQFEFIDMLCCMGFLTDTS
jgi:hypothetical protein